MRAGCASRQLCGRRAKHVKEHEGRGAERTTVREHRRSRVAIETNKCQLNDQTEYQAKFELLKKGLDQAKAAYDQADAAVQERLA